VGSYITITITLPDGFSAMIVRTGWRVRCSEAAPRAHPRASSGL